MDGHFSFVLDASPAPSSVSRLTALDLTGMSGCLRLARNTLCARTNLYQCFVCTELSLDLRSRPTLLVLIAHFAFR
jgi:hypothetical protein